MTPPLRDRREDIPELVRHFIAMHAGKAGRVVNGIALEAESLLVRYEWPGNVRQLQNVIQRAIVLGCEDFIIADDLPREIREGGPNEECDPERNMKRRLVEFAFMQSAGDYRTAAALLKRDPKNMHRTLRRLNLSHLIRRNSGTHPEFL